MDRKRNQQNKKRSRLQKLRDDKQKSQHEQQSQQNQLQPLQLIEEMKASLSRYQDLEKDLSSALSKNEELKTKLGEEKAKILMVEASKAELSKELAMARKTIEEQAAKIEALEKVQPKPRSTNRFLRILFPCL